MLDTISTLLLGGLILLAVLPALFSGLGLWLAVPTIKAHRIVLAVIVTGPATLGLVWIGWAAWTRIRVALAATTATPSWRRLIMGGPYRYSRHPLALGATLYSISFGTLFASLGVGLFAGLVMLVFLSIYHGLLQERWLLSRFGETYRRYRERTPFLIPSLTRIVDRRL
jgi:protein-S-isoprenylcysteine O-methyltransferase Ste14